MKRYIVMGLCLLAVAFALFIALGSFVPSLGRRWVADNPPPSYTYGDLYKLSELKQFRTPIPVVDAAQTTTMAEADIWAMGDSYFESRLETHNIPGLLAEKLNQKVFYEPNLVANPLDYVESIHYTKGSPKILIFETVEREAIDRALNRKKYTGESGKVFTQNAVQKVSVFDSTRVDYFFKHNVIVSPIRHYLKYLNFTLFGRVDPLIGAYSPNPPMLFYRDGVDFAHFKTLPLGGMVSSIDAMSERLREEYNIVLVYVVIPNKYTMYYDLIPGGSYNGFMEALQTELDNTSVLALPVYSVFSQYRAKDNSQLLYIPSDSHLSGLGKHIVSSLLADQIKLILKAFKEAKVK